MHLWHYKTAGPAERMDAQAGGLQWDGSQPLSFSWTLDAALVADAKA